MNKTLKAHYAQTINLDNALISIKNGERKFTPNLFSVWHNDEKLFAKNNDRNRTRRLRSLKRRENLECYALKSVAEEFELGTKPI